MTSRWQWLLSLITRRLWFRATIISLLGVASALVSLVAAPFVPPGLASTIGADSVETILTIIASSMLAVTTFSLSTMVSAYSAATANVTPRATRLLIEDTTTQNVLATFVGSFLFSLVAIITLSMGAYGERGRVVLFAVTIVVVLLIVVTLLRWIDYLLGFGRVGETTQRVEDAAERALIERRDNPYLGGSPLLDPETQIPDGALAVFPDRIGYVQHVDISRLSDTIEECRGEVYLVATPGTFVDPGRPLAYAMAADMPADFEQSLRNAFTVGNERSFDQDPRFGLAVLAEVGSRALSSAMNDFGTAIDVIGRSVRLLWLWTRPVEGAEDPRFPRVYVPPIEPADLMDAMYVTLGRDAAGIVEVQIRLQKAFAALARSGDARFAVEAARHSAIALTRAEKAMSLADDIERVRQAARQVTDSRASVARH